MMKCMMTMMDIQIKPSVSTNVHPNLFSWKDLENIINFRPLLTGWRVKIPNTEGLPTSWSSDPWTTPGSTTLPPSIIKEIIDTRVIFINEMSRCNEKVNEIAKNLEEKYKGSAVDAHIYIGKFVSPSHPFGIHFDYNDNYIVQCEGKTHWKIWEKVKDKDQEQSHLSIDEDPIIDVVLNPGDVINVPAYYPHLAVSLTPRLSISFPLIRDSKHVQERDWIKL